MENKVYLRDRAGNVVVPRKADHWILRRGPRAPEGNPKRPDTAVAKRFNRYVWDRPKRRSLENGVWSEDILHDLISQYITLEEPPD